MNALLTRLAALDRAAPPPVSRKLRRLRPGAELRPLDGSALYLIGLGQLHLGRFEDALATFELADRHDIPAVSRWTWLLGAGLANLLLERNEGALAWLERSIAITPASGRSHMLLAVAYQRLGRADEATAAMTKGLELRPGSTAANVMSPTRNTSPRVPRSGRKDDPHHGHARPAGALTAAGTASRKDKTGGPGEKGCPPVANVRS